MVCSRKIFAVEQFCGAWEGGICVFFMVRVCSVFRIVEGGARKSKDLREIGSRTESGYHTCRRQTFMENYGQLGNVMCVISTRFFRREPFNN